jgi:hypothetical protein
MIKIAIGEKKMNMFSPGRQARKGFIVSRSGFSRELLAKMYSCSRLKPLLHKPENYFASLAPWRE